MGSSIKSLIKSLCKTLALSNEKYDDEWSNMPLHVIVDETQIKRMETVAYGILLKKSEAAFHGFKFQLPEFTETDEILAYIFKLRLMRQFDKANRLETLLNRVRKLGEFQDDVRKVLHFLACLKGTGKEKDEDFQGMTLQLPVFTMPQGDEVCVLPSGPLEYGDTRLAYCDNGYYKNIPREFICKEPVPLSQSINASGDTVFRMFQPNFDFDPFGIKVVTSRGACCSSGTERPGQDLLFGAPFRKGIRPSVDMKLDLPPLSSDPTQRPLDFKIKNLLGNSPEDTKTSPGDEGLVSMGTPGSSGSNSNSTCDEDFWEAALKTKPKTCFTWETIGCYGVPKEKPYLSEAGLEAAEKVREAILDNVTLMFPTVQVPAPNKIPEATLVKHVLNLMLGISSQVFPISEDRTSFSFARGTYIDGLTTELLESVCKDFIDSATKLFWLEKFTKFTEPDPLKGEGLTLGAFKYGLQKYIEGYRYIVIETFFDKEFTVMSIEYHTRELRKQICSVTDFCKKVDAYYKKLHSEQKMYPMGIKLLSYLYNEALKHWTQDDYLILLSLLRKSFAPYLRFLQQWLFEGECCDPFNEFNVTFVPKYQSYKDEHYWTECYRSCPSDEEDKMPLLQHSVANDMFLCGKSLALLKTCNFQHHMLRASVYGPPLKLFVSREEAQEIKEELSSYSKGIEQLAAELQTKLKKRDLEDKEDQLRTFQEQREAQRMNLKRQKETLEQEARDKKKRYYEELKAQVIAKEESRKQQDIQEAKMAEKYIKFNIIEETTSEVVSIQTTSEFKERAQIQPNLSEECDVDLITFENDDSNLPNWAKRAISVSEDLSSSKNDNGEGECRSTVDQNFDDNPSDAFPDEISKMLSSPEGLPKWAATAFVSPTSSELQKQKVMMTANKLQRPKNIAVVNPMQVNADFDSTVQLLHSVQGISGADDKLFCESSGTFVKKTQRNVHGHASDSNVQSVIYGWSVAGTDHLQTSGSSGQSSDMTSSLLTAKMSDSSGRSDVGSMSVHSERSIAAQITDSTCSVSENKPLESTVVQEETGVSSVDEAYDSGSTPEVENVQEVKEVLFLPKKSKFRGLSSEVEKFVELVTSGCGEKRYLTDFSILREFPGKNTIFEALEQESSEKDINPDDFKVYSLPFLIQRSLLPVIQTQVRLVNRSLLSYFKEQLPMKDHLSTLRNFMFFQDGEFGHALSQLLFDKLSTSLHCPDNLLNPYTLNFILEEALEASLLQNKEYANNLSFAIRKIPKYFVLGDSGALKCLELRYKVPWPCNIVITESHIDKYAKVFSFLLRIKYAIWSLTQVWYDLKYTANVYSRAHASPQLRILQLYRHEMLHFALILQCYVISQVLQDLWRDFQRKMNRVENFEELCAVHQGYLEQAVSRCMLGKNGVPVHLTKVINKILDSIVQFHSVLTAPKCKHSTARSKIPKFGPSQTTPADSTKDELCGAKGIQEQEHVPSKTSDGTRRSKAWHVDQKTDLLVHCSYKQLEKLYKQFKENARYLYRVVADWEEVVWEQDQFLALMDAGLHYESSRARHPCNVRASVCTTSSVSSHEDWL